MSIRVLQRFRVQGLRSKVWGFIAIRSEGVLR